MRDFQTPGRSAVRTTQAMVATSHPLSTLAALDVLREGGTAMDAAICAAAVQAVVEPQSTGIGGDCFVLHCPGGGDRVLGLNGSGRAPGRASIEALRGMGLTQMPTFGPHSVTTPGAIDAWFRLSSDHGRLPMARLLEPAIAHAEDGYVIYDRVAFDWQIAAPRLAEDPASAAIFLPGGAALQVGDLHRQPALAQTLRIIAQEGRAAFYDGDLARAMVAHLQSLGGVHDPADWAATRSDAVTPISTGYRGYRVHQVPPNNQGLTALVMLDILSGFDLAALDPDGTERLHLEIEASRLAYADRDRHLGEDPGLAARLLAPGHAPGLRAAIHPDRRIESLPEPELATSDTVYISVVDRDRNAVSFINSTYHSFGAGITCPQTGIIFQNRGASFRLDAAHPNALAPRKRPLHTIMPGMVTKDGHAVMPYGVMGGDYQPAGHVHLLANLLDYGMDLQQAIDHPRAFHDGRVVQVERGVPARTIAGLQDRGHEVACAAEPHGGAQAIWIDRERGTLTGASDPRKDGIALGY
ncbi:gamma-glutamyltransferase [Paracoccus liaowanqingii]|uniref:Glutathione hydrolase proenzyme n=1 Tax=Paracoccus liaowanqingii TaxID=2560053 RepID=A0A4Z1CLU9_9RHOB|nr:gamma-glutamyltransferase [Paracoccus liaowanqingii]TGN62400.1 gamma-glutamyltransferase [Paracoccus liaowanqingii]